MAEFLSVLRRGISQMIITNLIYFLVTLPLTALCMSLVYGHIGQSAEYSGLLLGVGILVMPVAYLPQPALVVLIFISAAVRGPALMYEYRLCAWICTGDRLEHKQPNGVLFGLLDALVLAVFAYNITGSFGFAAEDVVLDAARYLSAIALAAYMMVRPGFFVMAAVTGKSLKPVIKNTLICSVLHPGTFMLAAALCAAVWVITLFTVPLATLILLPAVSFSACWMIQTWLFTPMIRALGDA